jgi:hypothetical protein
MYPTSKYPITKLIEGYADWIVDLKRNGWSVYLTSVMFNWLPGSTDAILAQMTKTIESRLYPNICRAVDRHPGRPGRFTRLPKLSLFPDLPCPKHEKLSLREVKINHGLHYQGFISISPWSRLKVPFEKHVERKQGLYARGDIKRLHVTPYTDSALLVADYSMKTIKKGLVDDSYSIQLPRLPKVLAPTLEPESKAMKDIQSATNFSDELASAIISKGMG